MREIREDGEVLPEPCPAARHGWGMFGPRTHDALEHDPNCQTCTVRAMFSEHDHLHLGRDALEPCLTPDINDVPGQNVKCKCGSFHH